MLAPAHPIYPLHWSFQKDHSCYSLTLNPAMEPLPNFPHWLHTHHPPHTSGKSHYHLPSIMLLYASVVMILSVSLGQASATVLQMSSCLILKIPSNVSPSVKSAPLPGHPSPTCQLHMLHKLLLPAFILYGTSLFPYSLCPEHLEREIPPCYRWVFLSIAGA